jgi:hypothetical protein
MPSMFRSVSFPVFSAVVIASCSQTAPPTEQQCDFKKDAQGNLVCVEVMGSSGGSSAMGGASGTAGGGGTVPNLGSGGSGGTVPNLGTGGSTGGAGGSGSAAGSGSGSIGGGGSGVGATGGSDPTAGTGVIASGGSGGSAGSGASAGDGSGGSAPVAGSGAGGSSGGASLGSIVVSAGEKARDHTVVSFPFPAGKGKSLVLKDMAGGQIALQVSPLDDTAIFILPSLAAGMTATYTVEELPAAAPDGVTAVVENEQLFVKQGTNTLFRWVLKDDNFRNRSANDVRSGYIYPLYTPAGVSVADDYAEDHPHMHGIWSAWTLTTFRNHKVDFWNGYDNSGHVDLTSMEGLWSGSVFGGLVANLQHDDITVSPPVTALTEREIVTIYRTHDAAPPYYVFDINSTQSTATTDPLILETYHYGGFGFRGAAEWATVANFLTSEGHNRTTGDGQRARWVAQWGTVNGKVGGYAAFDHPTNFRHPQGLRIHPTNPYWSFTASTTLAGGRFSIESGTPYKSRYRVVVFDGAADAALLNRLWDDFATPPTVTVMP